MELNRGNIVDKAGVRGDRFKTDVPAKVTPSKPKIGERDALMLESGGGRSASMKGLEIAPSKSATKAVRSVAPRAADQSPTLASRAMELTVRFCKTVADGYKRIRYGK